MKYLAILCVLVSCSSAYTSDVIPVSSAKALRFPRSAYVVMRRVRGAGKATVYTYFPLLSHVVRAEGGAYGKIEVWGWGRGDVRAAISFAKKIALFNAIQSAPGCDLVFEPHYRVTVTEGAPLVVVVTVEGKAMRLKTDKELGTVRTRRMISRSAPVQANPPKKALSDKDILTQQEINSDLAKKCDENDYRSCARLAYRYLKGAGGKTNKEKSQGLFKKACDGGIKKACDFYTKSISL